MRVATWRLWGGWRRGAAARWWRGGEWVGGSGRSGEEEHNWSWLEDSPENFSGGRRWGGGWLDNMGERERVKYEYRIHMNLLDRVCTVLLFRYLEASQSRQHVFNLNLMSRQGLIVDGEGQMALKRRVVISCAS
ncbi:hypothetical protein Tco_0328993 [Tanacetum coccineum]